MAQIFDETESDEEDGEELRTRPPRASGMSSSSKEKPEYEDVDVRKMIVAGLSQGRSPTELMPLMLMGMVMDKDGKKKIKRKEKRELEDLLGGSDSGESGSDEASSSRGMRAVSTLHPPEHTCKCPETFPNVVSSGSHVLTRPALEQLPGPAQSRGLPFELLHEDPLAKREFAGSKQEMAMISGYMDALAKLRKKVRQTQSGNGLEDDDEGGHKPPKK